jgi:hypothetical protein
MTSEQLFVLVIVEIVVIVVIVIAIIQVRKNRHRIKHVILDRLKMSPETGQRKHMSQNGLPRVNPGLTAEERARPN